MRKKTGRPFSGAAGTFHCLQPVAEAHIKRNIIKRTVKSKRCRPSTVREDAAVGSFCSNLVRRRIENIVGTRSQLDVVVERPTRAQIQEPLAGKGLIHTAKV